MKKEKEELVGRISIVVAERASDEGFRKKALSVVRAKMGATVKREAEMPNITEDALGATAIKILEKLPERPLFKLKRMAGTAGKPSAEVIDRYLMRSVVNYCNDRLRRWTLGDEEGRIGSRARGRLPVTIERELGQEIENWDAVGSTPFEMDKLELVSLMARLEAFGISDEDKAYIDALYHGYSYEDLAKKHGGTEGKYRKRLKRVFDKLQ
ncbi:hypothetical protein [Spongiibacter marinus]|uniref:hypothetical protein n=1 Tax=Spongiibacter marinus TaxID=354246 RepID=UPI0003F5587F|nr:hypothetical protein [Spongiibacter marinus]